MDDQSFLRPLIGDIQLSAEADMQLTEDREQTLGWDELDAADRAACAAF